MTELTAAERDWYVDSLSSLVQGGRTPQAAANHMTKMHPREAVEEALLEYWRAAGALRDFTDPPGLISGDLNGRYRPWYIGPRDSDETWPPQRESLKARGLPPSAIESIDTSTNRILSLLPSPGESEFDARGLVLGYVQSGKTANYSALIAKASDAGYKLFVVLAGIHNTLRSQTQKRLNRELRDQAPERWHMLTDESTDFQISGGITRAAAVLGAGSSPRVLVVIKKNDKRLSRLQEWLDAAGPSVLASCPTLVIDDEADQASINVGESEQDPSTINGQIINLLKCLPKVAYVGYTATPFANVLINPALEQDLYPRDFIVSLPRPEGYFGAESVYGRDRLDADQPDSAVAGLDVIRTVPVEETVFLQPRRNDRERFQPILPPSLKNALDYFWMATAARRARGQGDQHSSMLVHTTLYAAAHERIQALLREYSTARLADLEGPQSDVAALRGIWNEEMHRGPAASHDTTQFDDLIGLLPGVIRASEFTVENGLSDSRLSYDDDEPKIALITGGNTLSRGLTLEGLVVSYFIRAATAYDTLLQMGRWFGYRRGYEDLPRVWMTSELEDWFRSLALVEHEVRQEIARYQKERLTPLDFGPRIRTHPALAITAAAKMRSAVWAKVSFGGRLVQTITFEHRNPAVLAANRTAVETMLVRQSPGQCSMKGPKLVIRDVPVDDVLQLVEQYQFHIGNQELKRDPLMGYVKSQAERGNLRSWNVCVVGRRRARRSLVACGHEIGMLERSKLDRPGQDAYLGVVTSNADLSVDLDDFGGVDVPSDVRKSAGPLLLVYPINRDSQPGDSVGASKRGRRVELEALDDLFGLAFIFPETDDPTDESYVTADLSGLVLEEELVLGDEEEGLDES